MPYQPADRVDRVLDAAGEAVELLFEMGAPLPAGQEVRIVGGPLRIQLAQALPGVVFVSDQLFDIFPLQRFLKFHEFELARAIYESWVARRTLAVERADDRGWAPGAAASYLVDLYTLRSYRKAEFAREILAWASFIPAIDRVMYAPQVPFASSYFYTLEDPDPLRDNLQQFDNTRPTGKTIYTKLRDLLGTPAVDVLTRAQLGGVALRAAGRRSCAATSLDWFWQQWLGPYPKVDYRFADVRSERLGKHAYRHSARVIKVGEQPPVEPVEVRATDRKGNIANQTWDGVGREHTYVFDMPAALSVIEIDPRGRLVEDLPGYNDDLKFDDRRPPRWKFIYNNFGGLLRFFPTLGIDLSLDFSLSRILDLHHGLRFVVYRSESTQVGVTSSYSYGFGRKITAARLAAGARLLARRRAHRSVVRPGGRRRLEPGHASDRVGELGLRQPACSSGSRGRRSRSAPPSPPTRRCSTTASSCRRRRLRGLGIDRAARRRTRPGDVAQRRHHASAI